MSYVFKENIEYSQYEKFIKKYNYVSFMQEDKWSKTKDNDYLIVGVLNKKEICAAAHIIIKKKKNNIKFVIPNGFLVDFTNKSLLKFLTDNIKILAKKYKAYIIDIYPNISTKNPNCYEINTNLLNLNYKFKDEYIDETTNLLIPLKRKKKKISKLELKSKYENKDFYLKRGIYFEISNKVNDIHRLEKLINQSYFDKNIMENLINNFDNRIKMVFARLDLVFYLNFLKENSGNVDEINKIEELLTISDEIDVGCALIVEPYNDKGICEFLYNTEKESFESLDITNGLLYEAMKIGNEKSHNYIKISNLNLNINEFEHRYNAINIKYIGHYYLVLNKIRYFLYKEIGYKKRKTNSN